MKRFCLELISARDAVNCRGFDNRQICYRRRVLPKQHSILGKSPHSSICTSITQRFCHAFNTPMPPKKASSRHVTRPVDQSGVEGALTRALMTASKETLFNHVLRYCDEIVGLREALQRDLVVRGADVVRYHEDSTSEDAEDDEASETEAESGSEKNKKASKPISIQDGESTPRWVKCLNCKKEFDVTNNDKGACLWHPGQSFSAFLGSY
jgi:hypothetical protein